MARARAVEYDIRIVVVTVVAVVAVVAVAVVVAVVCCCCCGCCYCCCCLLLLLLLLLSSKDVFKNKAALAVKNKLPAKTCACYFPGSACLQINVLRSQAAIAHLHHHVTANIRIVIINAIRIAIESSRVIAKPHISVRAKQPFSTTAIEMETNRYLLLFAVVTGHFFHFDFPVSPKPDTLTISYKACRIMQEKAQRIARTSSRTHAQQQQQ